MRILNTLVLLSSFTMRAAMNDDNGAMSLGNFILRLGITPELIKFPKEADYTKHHYPDKLNVSMETLTHGVMTVTRALSKIQVKSPDDSSEIDFFKCMISAEIISEFIKQMHNIYREEAYKYEVDPAFHGKTIQRKDELTGCETTVGKNLHLVQKRASELRDFMPYLEKFRIAQNQYPHMSSAKSLKHAVREVFIEADKALRQEALSKQPDLQLDGSFAEFIAAKKQAKVDFRGLKNALKYLKSKHYSDISAVALTSHIV